MRTEDILKIIFLILLMKVSICSNLVVCLTIATCKKLRNAFNCLVVSLAVADLLVGIVVIPSYCFFVIKDSMHLSGGTFYAYAVYLCFDIFTGLASIINITVMSIDRALLLFSPQLHQRTLAKPKNVFKVIAVVWFFAAVMVMPKIMQFNNASNIDRSQLVIGYFLLGFIIPIGIIAASYVYIFAKHAKCLKRCPPQLKKELRLAYITLVIVVIFVLCWGPFFSIMLYHTFCKPCSNMRGFTVFSKWMQFFHSCCNPFIYALLQPSLRQAFKKFLKRCHPCAIFWKTRRTDEQVEMNTEQFPMNDTEQFPMNDTTTDDMALHNHETAAK